MPYNKEKREEEMFYVYEQYHLKNINCPCIIYYV